MIGGVGKVKCAWYTGPPNTSVGGKLKTELEMDSIYGIDNDANEDRRCEN